MLRIWREFEARSAIVNGRPVGSPIYYGGAVATFFETFSPDGYTPLPEIMNGLKHYEEKLTYILNTTPINMLEYRYEL